MRDYLLERWKPLGSALVASLLGFVILLLLSQDRPESTERRVYLETRIGHADETAGLLGRWEDATLQMLRHCADVRPSAAKEKSPAALAGDERRAARELLAAEFGALHLYFDAAVANAVRAFVEWENASRGADCDKLPAAAEIRERTGNLVRALRASVVPREFRE